MRLYKDGSPKETALAETDTPKPDHNKKPETAAPQPAQPREIGGPKGPEPTRYNDWEKGGRCVDF